MELISQRLAWNVKEVPKSSFRRIHLDNVKSNSMLRATTENVHSDGGEHTVLINQITEYPMKQK